jgi:ABC-2 type transport system ATP-binding protein
VKGLKTSHTILLSTHILSEVESTCDRALVIHEGRLVAQGSLAELGELGAARTLVASLRDGDARAEAVAREIPAVTGVRALPAPSPELRELELEVTGDLGDAAEALARAFGAAGIGIRSLAPGKASLEAVFSALTEPGERSEEAPR